MRSWYTSFEKEVMAATVAFAKTKVLVPRFLFPFSQQTPPF
jgi:hypothetical protein